MSIPDELLEEYIDLATNFPVAEKQTLKTELAGANPMQIKKAVAQNIVAQYHDEAAAAEAAETFARKVQRKEIADTDYEVMDAAALGIAPGSALVDVIYAIFESKKQPMSKGDIRRVAEGGGITLDGEKVTALNVPLPTGLGEIKLRVGKRNHFRVLLAA
jgi:tyrosyl-tRNA synthetase